MGVDVSKLKLEPMVLTEEETNATITFNALVDNLDDNEVRLTFFVEPNQPVFILDNNNERKKSVRWNDSFATSPASYSKQVLLFVEGGEGTASSCSIRIEAADSQGYRSSSNSFLIINR